MSEENDNNVVQPEKPAANNSEQATQQSAQPEKESVIKELNFSESAVKNAGDQGISLNPVGSHRTNPFTSQDVIQSQTVIPQPTSSTETLPSPSQSSGGESSEE